MVCEFFREKKKDLVFVKSLPINTEILDKDNNLIIKLTKNISSEIYKLLNEFHRKILITDSGILCWVFGCINVFL